MNQPVTKAARLEGAILDGKYEVVRLIGEGGMGAVYEARHRLIGRKLAVKVLHPDVARDTTIVQRFCNEARIAGSLGHENIIEITDLGQLRSGAPYIVMEYLDGQSLAGRIHDAGPLSIEESVEIVSQVLGALDCVHAAGVVHRDLKPDNVFLARRAPVGGRQKTIVKVLDFGVSKLRDPAGVATKLTQTGSMVGTPCYMSPEQAEGQSTVDHRADIYAVGAILYEALTKHVPFEAQSFAGLIAAIMTKAPPPPRTYRVEIPDQLEQVILKALARDPSDRFSSASEFLAAIESYRPAGRPTSSVGLPTGGGSLGGSIGSVRTPSAAAVTATVHDLAGMKLTDGSVAAKAVGAKRMRGIAAAVVLVVAVLAGVLVWALARGSSSQAPAVRPPVPDAALIPAATPGTGSGPAAPVVVPGPGPVQEAGVPSTGAGQERAPVAVAADVGASGPADVELHAVGAGGTEAGQTEGVAADASGRDVRPTEPRRRDGGARLRITQEVPF